MPTFRYSAINAATGRECAGRIDGRSAEDVTRTLKSRGLAPTSLTCIEELVEAGTRSVHGRRRPEGNGSAGIRREPAAVVAPRTKRWRGVAFGRPVSARALALFTRQLATLVRAGMPLVRGLEVLARQESGPRFREIVNDLAATIRAGESLSEALAQHPRVFDRLYVSMARAGEAGGVLHVVLERLAAFLEKSARLKARIAAAMTYPVIVLALAGGIVAALMVFVVPRFEQIFSGLLKGQPLPTLTRLVLGVSGIFQHHGGWCLALVAIGVMAFALVRRTARGRSAIDWAKLHCPVVGPLLLKTAIARFSRTLGTLLASGVPILQALLITRDTSGNTQVSAAIALVHERVKAGENVAGPLAASGVFPAMVVGLAEVGEETGKLPEMLGRIADAYEEEVDNAVAGLTAMIEPVLIVVLAVLVGTVVLALFLPIISVIQYLQ
ncbi:type II secretion system F family protein [Opitutus terrae]|uniref:General secretion pathway protein F n=1 Tax=Opitutus terrae (strain DSM 11246 / JCM 15787 / PB90-1) TaxID=452637 RepID=B1ZZG3_OPITP|nr:type II secretion system F family protein [Opitutus terrae]ACB76366.1 type II secretion system protein [Opitutus terrae PB90-1]